MSLSNIIEQSIKNLDSLPTTVQKNMMEIRRMDAACQRMTLDAQVKVRQLIAAWKSTGKDQRKKLTEALKADFAKMRELSEEKIRLSEQTYELVDKYIIRLDNDTAKLNAAVRRKFADSAALAGILDGVEPEGSASRKRKSSVVKRDGKRMKKADRLELIATQDAQPYANPTAPLVDMPVDPNEPTYCTCHQVSFGQMVMCDNKSCPIEWFHFQCVGLLTKPRGKWYCESCTEQRRKKIEA